MGDKITTSDRILKELDLIQQIYNVQFSKINPDSWIHIIFDENSNHIDGRFMNNIEICSEIKLFEIQSYKDEFTHRYESTQNTKLLKNQLSRIKDRAAGVRDYYNDNLSDNTEIVTAFYNHSKEIYDDAKSHYDFTKSHQALILVNDSSYISGVYYGCEHAHLYIDGFIPLPDRYEYVFLGNNHMLARYCQSLIDFIDDILIETIDKDVNCKLNNSEDTKLTETDQKVTDKIETDESTPKSIINNIEQ